MKQHQIDELSVIAHEGRDQAVKNIEKYGYQDLETLVLAITEETGELAQALLQWKHEGQPFERIMEEAVDLMALPMAVIALCHKLKRDAEALELDLSDPEKFRRVVVWMSNSFQVGIDPAGPDGEKKYESQHLNKPEASDGK